jgi:hypothetical protein
MLSTLVSCTNTNNKLDKKENTIKKDIIINAESINVKKIENEPSL